MDVALQREHAVGPGRREHRLLRRALQRHRVVRRPDAYQDRRGRRGDWSHPAVGPRPQQCPRGLVHGLRRHPALPRRRLHQGRRRGRSSTSPMWIDTASTPSRARPCSAGPRATASCTSAGNRPPATGDRRSCAYKIWRKLAGATKYPNAALATVSSGTTYADTTVTNATAYSYQVVAVNGVGTAPTATSSR